MKKIRVVLSMLVFLIIILISNAVQAKDYAIESIDMQVEIQENGDLKIDVKDNIFIIQILFTNYNEK